MQRSKTHKKKHAKTINQKIKSTLALCLAVWIAILPLGDVAFALPTADLTVTVSADQTDAEFQVTQVTIGGSGVTCTGNEFTVAETANGTETVTIAFSYNVAYVADTTAGSVTLGQTLDVQNHRTATYTGTVQDLRDASGTLTIRLTANQTGSVTAGSGLTVTIPDPWKKSNTEFYKPIGEESFQLTCSATDPNYAIYINNELYSGAGYSVNKDTSLTLLCKAMPPKPEGTFVIEPYYHENSEIIYQIGESQVGSDEELEFIVKDGNELPLGSDSGTTATYTTETGNRLYAVTVTADSSQSLRHVFVRKKNTGSNECSEWVSSPDILFDFEPPVIGNVTVNGIPVEGSQDIWINQTGTSIVVPVQDTLSGATELTYYFGSDAGTAVTAAISKGQTEVAISYGKEAQFSTLNLTLKDMAGNTVTKAVSLSHIKFDLTDPKAEMAYRDENGGSLTDPESAWQSFAVTVDITPADGSPADADTEKISGVQSIQVTDNDQLISGTQLGDGSYRYALTEDGEHWLNVTVTDHAGNSTTYTKHILLDRQGIVNPVVILGSGQSSFSEDFNITASAVSRSGLRNIRFEFVDETGIVRSTVVTDAVAGNSASCPYPAADLGNFKGTVRVTFTDVCGRTATVEKAFAYNRGGALIHISGNDFWSASPVEVQVRATDFYTGIVKVEYLIGGTVVKTDTQEQSSVYNGSLVVEDSSETNLGTQIEVRVTAASGYVTTDYFVVKVDRQAPSLEFNGITNGGVYNANRTLRITTVENIWQEMDAVSISATKTIDGTTSNMNYEPYTVTDASHLMQLLFSEDGLYQITVTARDAAGNTDSETISFTVDKTAPVLSMSGASDGTYSNAPVTIRFQAIESFFETDQVSIRVERKLEGKTYGRTVDFTNTGKLSYLNTTFLEDGDYLVTMTATDFAGNAAVTQTLSFTIDRTAPVVTLSGSQDYFVTNEAVVLDFSVIESYFETNLVQIQGTRRTAEGRTEALRLSGWQNTGKTSAMRQEFQEDGYYTITITATDRAGNRKSQTIHFTIDTEPPIIGDLSKYDGKYLASFRLDEKLEDLIIELSVPTVKMTLNGEAYDGREITADGKYTLVIEVVDELGLTASKTIEFVIDNTAPKIIFAGAENNKTYTSPVNLNLSLENENDTIVSILINGEPYEFTAGSSSYDLTFDSYGLYEVEVHTIDEAGNENTQVISFTYVSRQRFVFLWIVIGAAVAAAGLVIYLIAANKR